MYKYGHKKSYTVLNVRSGKRGNLGKNFLIYKKTRVFCDPSLAPSCQRYSTEGNQLMFYSHIRRIIVYTPSYLELWIILSILLGSNMVVNELKFAGS